MKLSKACQITTEQACRYSAALKQARLSGFYLASEQKIWFIGKWNHKGGGKYKTLKGKKV